jgi:hypothetical protein
MCSKRVGWIVREVGNSYGIEAVLGGGAKVPRAKRRRPGSTVAKAGDLTIHLRSDATPLTALDDALRPV